MKRDIFTNTSTGTLRMLSGEYPSRYGLISYETPSFIPDPLGDYPTLTMRTLGAVNRASMAVARLSELGERLPNPDLMRRPALRREAQSTSALEGTYERLETVLAQDYEPGGSTVELNATMREILNYVDAANCNRSSYTVRRPTIHRQVRFAIRRYSSARRHARLKMPDSCQCRQGMISTLPCNNSLIGGMHEPNRGSPCSTWPCSIINSRHCTRSPMATAE